MKTIDRNITIQGKRINLRRIRKPDARSIYQYAREWDIAKYTFIPHPYEIEDANIFIKDVHSMIRRNSGLVLGIENPDTNQVIGTIGSHNINWRHRRAEIGYWLGKKYWGNGYASEAVMLFLSYLFETLELNRVFALVMDANEKSGEMLVRLGFTCEGRQRQVCLQYKERYDYLYYGILRDEFRKL